MFISKVEDHIDKITIVDIGAMEIAGFVSPMYEMARHPKVELIGFEPQDNEREKVIASFVDRNVTILPHIVADGTVRPFYETEAGLVSGLFPLDQEIGRKLNYPESAYSCRSIDNIETVRLDDIEEVKEADFLKIDTEGAEGIILDNGKKTLERALVVEIEVNLLPNQVGGSAYWEIGQRMQNCGFLIHQFHPMKILNFRPWVEPAGISQHHAADAVFVRDFRKLDRFSDRDLVATGVLLHDLYKSADIASYFFQQYGARTGNNLFKLHSDFITSPQT